jgi:hypothetical protein
MPGFRDGATAMQGRSTPELITRVRELRRRAFSPPSSRAPEPSLQRQVNDLRVQIAQLEQLVQGLQDAVYRDVRRQDERITEIQERIAPGAIASALSEDARKRGL